MKQSRFSKVLSLLLAVLMVLSLTTPATVSAAQPADSSAVQVELNVNETKALKVSGWYRNTTWTSSDPSVVTVDSHGVITAEAEGTATVTAVSTPWFSFAGGPKTTTFAVTVTGSSEAALTVKVNEELPLSVNPDGGTVTWTSSDEKIAVVSPEGVVKGVQPGDVTVTAEIVKVKYLFFGWVKREIRCTECFEITVLPADPETPNIYTVTFESNGGSAVEAQQVEAGKMAMEPAAPTRDNYEFAGWYTDTAFTNLYDFQTPVTADVTLYAKWDDLPEEYSVVFESNGGTVVFTQFVEEGQTVQKPEPPIKSGYIFAGWYADAELTVVYDFTAPVTENLTLYAKWDEIQPETYTVTFESNGGSAVEAQQVEAGKLAVEPAVPTRNNYNFVGWYTDTSFTNLYDFQTPVTADVTLYAKWEAIPEEYSVVFESNGGTVVFTQFVEEGQTVQKPEDPIKSGCVFAGWYADAELTVAYDFAAPVTENLTLYAKWDEENGAVDPEDPAFKTDDDHDGMPNAFEEAFGTDVNKEDTDGDGLSDYDEIFKISTDPLLTDSDNNGIADGEEDPDADGLNNLEEIKAGSDPREADTDLDMLSDGEEVHQHHTDPVKSDTDGDGLTDGAEVKLGLDPLSAMTDGKTPDAERTFEQKLDDSLIDESLKTENELVPSIHGNVADDLNSHITIQHEVIDEIHDNRAVMGKSILVHSTYPEESDLWLDFTCQEEDPRMDYYLICQYKDNAFIPCETVRDGNTISTHLSSGKYFIIDAEALLIDLGFPIEKYRKQETAEPVNVLKIEDSEETSNEVSDEWYAENYIFTDSGYMLAGTNEENQDQPLTAMQSSADQPVSTLAESSGISGQADIVFVIDTTGSMSDEINNVASNIEMFVNELLSKFSVQVNFALVDYKDITEPGEDTKLVKDGDSEWFRDVTRYIQSIRSMRVTGGGDGPETLLDGLGMAEGLSYRQNANKFVVVVTDANYKNDNHYGIASMEEMTQRLKDMGIVTSVISKTSYEELYHNLYTSNNGVFGDIDGNFKDILMELANRIGEIVNDGSWVVLSDYQIIKLKQPLEHTDAGSDNDGVSDWDELGTEMTSDLSPYIDHVMKTYGLPAEAYEDIRTIKVFDYVSNPVLDDTDYDGINDNDDRGTERNNTFLGTMYGHQQLNHAMYTVDYRDFYTPNSEYQQTLAQASLLFANAAYGGDAFKYDTGEKISGLKNLMVHHGFDPKTTIVYKLNTGLTEPILGAQYKDDNITEVGIGIHSVTYQGIPKTVVGVFVRGTNGTVEEWSSNFDVGNPADWNSTYHKGFYKTAVRVMDFLNDYRNTYLTDKENIVYWLTGHSRGAAISNILSGMLADEGNTVYAYNFAVPNTTVSETFNANKYNGIFNFVNTGDVVPAVPLNDWDFHRFGITIPVDMDRNCISKWKYHMNAEYAGTRESAVETLVDRLHRNCAPTWADVFECSDPQQISIEEEANISDRAKRFCLIEKRLDKHDELKGYNMSPSTAYVMQLGAEWIQSENATLKDNAVHNLLELWNTRYGVLVAMIACDLPSSELNIKDLFGAMHSHIPCTYYVLLNYGANPYRTGGGSR